MILRVGRVDALDVGEDLTAVGAQCGGQRDGGRVGAAAAERGDLVDRRDALEAGDEDDLALVESGVDALGPNLDDLRLGVRGVGDDPGLRAGQRDRLVAEILDRHLGQGARDALADRDQHVHRPRLRPIRDPVRELDELVGRVAHRGEDGDDAAALLLGGDDPPRHGLQAGSGRRRRCRRTSSRACRPCGPRLVETSGTTS